MKDPQLASRIDAFLRGSIAPDEFAALEEQLAHDPNARREFRRATNLESALRDWASRAHTLDPWLTAPAATGTTRRNIRTGWFAAAAAVVVFGGGVALTWGLLPRRSAVVAALDNERTAQGCAVLTQSAGAQWSGDLARARLGDVLNTGALNLKEGLAQIEFFSGAKFVVEGPAQFQIVSPWEVVWQHGKVRIHVPPAARGFRLQTPGMKLVDLGTEFGVEVNRDTQDLRVAVFAGEVIAHPVTGDQLTLRQGEGIARNGAQLERTTAGQPDHFANGQGLQQLSRRHAKTRFAAWVEASRAQARDPRLIAYYPLEQIDAWSRIVPNAATPANSELDGGAVGVSTAAGRWPEKGALEFKRPGDRVRLQIEGTYQSLTFTGWVMIDGLDRTYNALFLTDGYEVGEPHWQIYEDGRLMFSLSYPDSSGKRHNQIYYSPVVFDAANTGRWHHIAVTYDNQSGEVVQFMDGRELSREVSNHHVPGRPVVIGPSELGNWGLPTANHRFPIRNLNGRLDEFALYRAVLSPDEIRTLYESGKPE